MRRHLGVGSVDLRLVQTGFDDGDLGVVRDKKTRHTANRCEGARVRANPIGKCLRPGRLDIGEVRRPHDGHWQQQSGVASNSVAIAVASSQPRPARPVAPQARPRLTLGLLTWLIP